MIKYPGQSLLQTSRSACCNTYLWPQIRGVIKFPVAVVREGGGAASGERIEAGGAGGGAGGRFGGLHAWELVANGRPPVDGVVVEATPPLEDEGEEGEGEGEDGQKEEQPRRERLVRRRRRRRRRGERRRGGGSTGVMQTRHGRSRSRWLLRTKKEREAIACAYIYLYIYRLYKDL